MLAIQEQLKVPLEQQRLSTDPALLTAKNGASIRWDAAVCYAGLPAAGPPLGDCVLLLVLNGWSKLSGLAVGLPTYRCYCWVVVA